MTESVEILSEQLGGGSIRLWDPAEGSEVHRMLSSLPPAARDQVRQEALDVLGQCLPPGQGRGRRAGLVVGQVQSGKTASFTAVAALSRDNRIPLVILIAGTKTNLLEQSRKRLGADLGLAEPDAHRRWMQFESPAATTQEVALLSNHLTQCLQAESDEPHVAALITVMKNGTHMQRLARTLRGVGENVDLSKVTAVVIDDEVDQATPNLKWKSESESATYRHLRKIREELPRHTLLEYTATPQAPLLVNLADEISPDFTCVLTPGAGYTGGRFFFQDNRDQFVRLIPPSDLGALDPTHPDPPKTLFHAMATFFVGVAVGELTYSAGDPPQRSMLVHPSQATAPHSQFARWVKGARDQWVTLLESSDRDDIEDWVSEFLDPAFEDLGRSVEGLPDKNKVLARLPRSMRMTRVEEINTAAGVSSSLNWAQAYSWIIIGGAMMDRGFTVEGLTITYMPRPVGVGNADTVQQRARFFGYKAAYAGFCRAWLSAQVADVFDSYVQHEERMRHELQAQAVSGQSLKQWRRRFLLDKSLRPTRRAVISILYSHFSWADAWFQQWHVPLPPGSADEADIGASNKDVVEGFLKGRAWRELGSRPPLTEMQSHHVTEVPVQEVLELFADFAMVEDDVAPFAALMMGMEDLADRPGEMVAVMNMSQGRARKRSLADDSTRLLGLFQGRSRDGKYVGDRKIHHESSLTLQVHWIVPSANDGTEEGGPAIRSVVPVIAMYVPRELSFGALVETP